MANPRQRRKGKSSTYKAISCSKRAKRLQKKMPVICGPRALQDAWDPTKTVRQNYLSLGLAHDLNPISSGGSETNTSLPRPGASSCATTDPQASVSEGSQSAPALRKGFGRIIKDSSGNVVRVELPCDEETENASEREMVIDAPVATTEAELRIWAHDHLEKLGASGRVRERHASLGERAYLERMVKKYGKDVEKMAHDRRVNPEQRTANELMRAITKAGGFGGLCKDMGSKVAE
ncbi:ribosome biogenesis protein Nop16 [Chiua virens]|nr:ribosome biogenesis protein Nop16 [Chiua virens]